MKLAARLPLVWSKPAVLTVTKVDEAAGSLLAGLLDGRDSVIQLSGLINIVEAFFEWRLA